MDLKPILRNWLWPVLAAVCVAGYTAFDQGCVELACMAEPLRNAAVAAVLTKFKALAGKDQPWFDHEKAE